ncbi:leucyl/phenylalanyl-tRNA--protein transferase [Aggregicoccus sp. 17bor-14]|uniref:leucyl/phenylalanyl-tRNA--protein transferase n=1 Tax=Myxococcaceae TaxID=31 RepID=UPI0012EF1B88|nr:leucyl/phenylalanyl-tRNA--protein transferase [Simulacricoccus sp. 17bor-14]MRI89360.1 leucyl/phenylalanyl-tRNA--protein transferase [Aggregicoccus sp. 17bor-14]
MPIYLLNEDPEDFPPPERADRSGLLAVGGDLRPERLLAAYTRGIFPWYSEGQPLLWHSPDPRFVLEPARLHVGKSLKKTLKRAPYQLRWDTAFERVIDACAEAPRPGQSGTWITPEMRAAYVTLHRLGFAHSCEAWEEGRLVGGFYGVSLGAAFFGESMFAHAPDASKVAFATAVQRFAGWGFHFVDCQVETEHLARFGAEDWPRRRFLQALGAALAAAPTRRGAWTQEA